MSFSIGTTAKFLGRGLALAAGGYAAYDVSKFLLHPTSDNGGSATGTVTGSLYSRRHVLLFAAEHALHPGQVLAAKDAFFSAELLEKRLFHADDQVPATDDGADAFRHTFAATKLTYQLERDGMSADDAESFVRAAGLAHENDSMLSGTHYENARAMDVHNNDVGIALGSSEAAASGGEPVDDSKLARDVLAAIASGQAVVLNKSTWQPSASQQSDIAQANTSSLD